ncbi:hypothetical protein PLAPEKGO_00137 [Klebsiella phage KP6]
MKTQFNQSQGSTSRETNKEAIARIFGLKKSDVSYLSTYTLVDSYTILYDKITQTCWYRGVSTGYPISWSVNGNTLTLVTSTGSFDLTIAKVDLTLRNEITSSDGYKLVGNCPDVVTLRTIEPTTNGQKILLSKVDTASGVNSGGTFYYDNTDTTSVDDGVSIIVTASGKRWKRPESYLDLAWFGAVPGKDISAAWNKAVALVDNYVRTIGFDGRKAIYIGAGVYPTSVMLDVPSWVSLVAIGNVTINGSTLPNDSFVVRIINKISGVSTTRHAGWNLGSIGGTLKLIGNSKTGNVDGLWVGNTSNMSDCRNVSLYAVATDAVRRGLVIGSINTYIFTATKCHFESSKVAVDFPNTTSSNAGEKMVFNDCVLAGSDDNHLQVATPGMDITLNNTSFDFTYGNVIYATETWGYSKIAIYGGHTEGYDGYFIKVDDPQSSVVGSNRSIMVSKWNNLPRLRGNIRAYNSPSRLKIDARSTPVYIDGIDQRHEAVPYTEDIFMASAETTLFLNGYIKDPYLQVPSPAYILNRGYNISDEVLGTVVNSPATLDSLTRFTCVERNAMSATVISGGSTGTVLKITGAGGYMSFATKDFVPLPPNSRIGLHLALSALSSTGNIQCTYSVAWYDVNDQLVSTTSSFSINMRTVFDDTTLPNYSEGNTRFISASARAHRAPVGAVKCKPRWQISGFTGDITISRMTSFLLP